MEETIEIKNQLSEFIVSGGFSFKKWCSNDKILLTEIPIEYLEERFPLYFGTDYIIKILNVIGDPDNDGYNIWINIKPSNFITKCNVLATSASIFDPFGILSLIILDY